MHELLAREQITISVNSAHEQGFFRPHVFSYTLLQHRSNRNKSKINFVPFSVVIHDV